MDAEQAAQQIQALTASLEEVTHQNEKLIRTTESWNKELQQTMENQNEEERQRIKGNHNEEGSDSQANKRTRASKENLSRMERELRNMRREMDDLKSVVKDKAVKNLVGMI